MSNLLVGTVGTDQNKLKLPAVVDPDRSPAAPVVRLLLRRCPATISRFIISVIVDSLDGVADRSIAHIGEEAFKRVFVAFADSPAIANADAATAVIKPVWAVLVGASRFQIRKSGIKVMFFPAIHQCV